MDSTNNYPFILHWVWGHQTKIPPINISTKKQKKVFYAAGPIGICYDWVNNKQYLLLGHKNDIISIAAAPNKKYLVSADRGEESAVIIWNADTRCIFYVIPDYFTSDGVVSICFSPDGKKLMALSGGKPQEISVWDWLKKKAYPDFTYKYKEGVEFQHYLTFHEGYSSQFASCGHKTVFFFEKIEDEVKSAMLDIRVLYDEKTSHQIGDFTQTAFSLVSVLAVTATTKGMIILWGRPLYSKEKPAQDSSEWFFMHPEQRVCIRMIQAMESKCPISYLSASDTCIIAGTGKGEILYYNEDFSIQWSKCFDLGPINSMSATYRPKFGLRSAVRKLFGKETELFDTPFDEKDFIICTFDGYVGYYCNTSRQLKQILWGTNNFIKSIALHPFWPFVYFGDYNGGLQKWNYNTKQLINNEVYETAVCSQVELITVDNKGVYAACVMSNGNLVIFDAICFTSKPCFTADEVLHKPIRIEFSTDSQRLIITDVSSYVSLYRLQLLVVPKVYQMMKKGNVPPEEPFWSYGGKTRQHQSHIVDSMFNINQKTETLFFYTLGEDRFLVEYNITSSKGLDIEVSKRIILERKPVPLCMTWYPLYNVSSLIAVLSDDGKMRIYSTDTEKFVRIVSLPLYEEPIKRIILHTQFKHMLKKEFPQCTDLNEFFQYFIFNCSHMIGISKYPIDGNPNTSLGVTSTPSGINYIISNKEHTFLFTAGVQDCWIFMHEVNIKALLDAEREGGEGVEAFKYLFPSSCDPDEMKQRLIYSVYSLELEMKMLKMGTEKPSLVGEIPISCLQYVLAALGCFLLPTELQLMLKDIDFESKYQHNGEKTTLTCLDIMKLYVSYRPSEPVTKSKLKETFNDILALEEDPYQMPRARFIDVLTTRGDYLSYNELSNILKCLQNGEDLNKEQSDSSDEDEDKAEKDDNQKSQMSVADNDYDILKTLLPELITEKVFFQDILCMEKAEEDLSKYVLKKDDYKMVQEYPKLEDFVTAIEKNNF